MAKKGGALFCRVDAAAVGPLTFKPVRIVGLSSRADLNGTCAVPFSFDAAKDRYKVYLVGTSPNPNHWPEEPIGVKPANLQELGKEDTVDDKVKFID